MHTLLQVSPLCVYIANCHFIETQSYKNQIDFVAVNQVISILLLASNKFGSRTSESCGQKVMLL